MMQASAILQSYLDTIGEAVLQKRFDAYCEAIHLPLQITTSVADINVQTVEELREGFDDFVQMIDNLQISDMIRVVKEARFDSEEVIVGIYETNLLNGAHRVVPAFFSRIELRLLEGVWKAARIRNTAQDARWPIKVDKVKPSPWPPMEILE